MLRGLFGKRTGTDPAATAALKDRVRRVAGLGEDVALAINEIVCADPACPGTETVILVMEPGKRTRAVKVAEPMATLTDEVILAAFAAEGPV